MTLVAGRNRVNRPYFFRSADGERVEFPAFGTGQGDLVDGELRMFQTYVTANQIEAIGPIPPAQFGPTSWSVAAAGDGADVTITSLPGTFGAELTGIAIRVDGEDIEIVDPETGTYPLVLAAGEYSIDIAAVSESGQGPWSAAKSVEVAE